MRVVILSSTQFGYEALREGVLPAKNVEVVGILTTPRAIEISYSDVPVVIRTHATFEDLAILAGCEVVELTGKVNSAAYLEYLEKWKPDLVLALGWYYMVPKKVREYVPMGIAGIHASLLPKYRGGAPLNWAIINGEDEAGVSLFYLEEGVDEGDIIAQEKVPILLEDDINTVYAKATALSINLLRTTLPRLAAGNDPRSTQDHSRATYVPQRAPADGLLKWDDKTAKQAHDFIRAQTSPYPGAFSFYNGKVVKLWKSSLVEKQPLLPEGNYGPGTIVLEPFTDNDAFGVCCGDNRFVSVLQAGYDEYSFVSGKELAEMLAFETGMLLREPSLENG